MTQRHDDTEVAQRERVVERPVAASPPPAGTSNVNVSADQGGGYGYARPVATAPGPLYWARRVLSLLFAILLVLIALRVLLFLLVANQTNAIVDFIYTVTEPFVAPFRGIFQFDQVSPGGASTLDVAALVAVVGWFLIYLLIMAILSLGDRNRTTA